MDRFTQEYAKLTEEQLDILGFASYDGEVILIDYNSNPVTNESFYFNAQEFFTDQQLDEMPWFSAELFLWKLDTKITPSV